VTLEVQPAVRRWLIVAALFVVSYGIATPLAAYGVFLPVLADTFAWKRGAIATALSVNLMLGGFAGWGFGALADRYGPRVVLAGTVTIAGGAFALVSTVGSLWQLYLFVGVLGGLGTSVFYPVSASTVVRWFDEWRGLALAFVLIGFNLGYISAGPLAASLIATVGWRAAAALIGSGCALATAAAALTVRLPRAAEMAALRGRRDPAAPDAAPTLEGGVSFAEALADPRQWCLNVAWLLLGGMSLMVSVHAVPFARDQGIGLAAASLALTAYGAGAACGRLAAGVVSDRIGTRTTIRAGYVIQVLMLVALFRAPSRDALLASLAAFGIGFGASDTMIAKIVPDLFGVRAIGAIIGILTLGWRCGAALGPAAAGFLYDVTGSYAVPFGAAPIVVLVSFALFTIASASPRPRRG
jgi:MFS family permease